MRNKPNPVIAMDGGNKRRTAPRARARRCQTPSPPAASLCRGSCASPSSPHPSFPATFPKLPALGAARHVLGTCKSAEQRCAPCSRTLRLQRCFSLRALDVKIEKHLQVAASSAPLGCSKAKSSDLKSK